MSFPQRGKVSPGVLRSAGRRMRERVGTTDRPGKKGFSLISHGARVRSRRASFPRWGKHREWRGNSCLPVSATGGGSPQFPLHRGAYKDHRMARTIANSIVLAAKRQVWQRMTQRVIRPMLIEMTIWPNSHPVWLRGKAARRKAFWLFANL